MYIKVKRLIDFILALIALIILSPLFLLIALWIKLDSKGPVFFKQKRIGKNRDFFIFTSFVPCYRKHRPICLPIY